MTRHFWVLMHRYVGLAMTIFLIIVGLTGSVLAFKNEIDLWLNPDLLRVEVRDAPMLDPLVLREKAEALDPRYRVDQASLFIEPSRSFEVWLTPRAKSANIKQLVTLPTLLEAFGNEDGAPVLYLDPYTGKILGERNLLQGLHGRKDIIWFLYRLHMTLALPAKYVGLGARTLGLVALVWTVDCFVSYFLTLPKWQRVRTASGRSWWARWSPAWRVKWKASAVRINFDLHRAFGLWTWAMLFIFAWSSVCFNLEEVYTPVMNTLFGAPPEADPASIPTPSARPALTGEPKMGWYQARDRGRVLLNEKSNKDGFTIKREINLLIDRNTGNYTLCADILMKAEDNQACIEFDADTGAAPPEPPQPTSASDQEEPLSLTIIWWITSLHMAAVFGLPMKIFVCLMGLVVTMLSVTGVYIWLKKSRAARLKRKTYLPESIVS